jgi:hypothetical protein
VGLEETPQTGVLEIGAIDLHGHAGSICRPRFGYVTTVVSLSS